MRLISLPSSFAFAADGHIIEGLGVRDQLTHASDDGLLGRASDTLAALGANDLLVGALPFAPDAPAALFVPHEIRRTRASATPRTEMPAIRRVTAEPNRRDYEAAVDAALATLEPNARQERGLLDKVVLARTLLLEFAAPLSVDALFDRLRTDASATAFSTLLTGGDPGGGRFVGASPELLIKRQGQHVTSLPMAGSRMRRVTDDDRAMAAEFRRSTKDQDEHRLVVESVMDSLAPFCQQLKAARSPRLTATATMWHLATPVQGEVKRDVSSLELALALHPTPAVCGTPRNRASEMIGELESFDRGLFAGAVGWCNRAGDGVLMVGIRCAEIVGHTARLFAGAGIVAGSRPNDESDETEAKFRTLLQALGADAAVMRGQYSHL